MAKFLTAIISVHLFQQSDNPWNTAAFCEIWHIPSGYYPYSQLSIFTNWNCSLKLCLGLGHFFLRGGTTKKHPVAQAHCDSRKITLLLAGSNSASSAAWTCPCAHITILQIVSWFCIQIQTVANLTGSHDTLIPEDQSSHCLLYTSDAADE